MISLSYAYVNKVYMLVFNNWRRIFKTIMGATPTGIYHEIVYHYAPDADQFLLGRPFPEFQEVNEAVLRDLSMFASVARTAGLVKISLVPPETAHDDPINIVVGGAMAITDHAPETFGRVTANLASWWAGIGYAALLPNHVRYHLSAVPHTQPDTFGMTSCAVVASTSTDWTDTAHLIIQELWPKVTPQPNS
jgi:hypothetical protein